MDRLDNQQELKGLDSLGMLEALDMSPSQCLDAIRLGDKFEWTPTIDVSLASLCAEWVDQRWPVRS